MFEILGSVLGSLLSLPMQILAPLFSILGSLIPGMS